ncbi:porin family protein [Sphingobacterium sp. lm-10]|uniref:outer membrane beta-barrel protein n=1 Tax=Sphingobacterium sp. lm-10 TaxID=2944904 RepID=UPI002021F4F5|nr:outer membrane beta-barrel protein [Sphingobacterium sp. lm-10]MCL7988014.1 porin family protein [Sphingobacterium sp. lm-10]
MKKIILLLVAIAAFSTVQAQEHDWAFGFYGDMNLQAPEFGERGRGSFGIQGKYDFALHHGVQALVHGQKDFVAFGADYIYTFLDRTANNWNVFAGGGASSEYDRILSFDENNIRNEDFNQRTTLNAQAGVSYYVPDVALSLYAGYKIKSEVRFKDDRPHFVMVGLRYHIW